MLDREPLGCRVLPTRREEPAASVIADKCKLDEAAILSHALDQSDVCPKPLVD